MRVKVISLGTNWWARSPAYAEAGRRVCYNTTGIECGRKVRRHWLIPGVVRFDSACLDGKLPAHPLRATFVCSELSYAYGGNRLLFQRRDRNRSQPDYYLVTVSSQTHGAIDFHSSVWRSIFTQVIAISQLREQQQAMLLMAPGDWLLTSAGFWQLEVPTNWQEAQLVRSPDPGVEEKQP